MQKLILAAIATLFAANVAFAADAGCDAKAAEKKLAGAAKASFLKKCEADAKAQAVPEAKAPETKGHEAAATGAGCEATAAQKKLAGAAKTSFLKKCMADSSAAVTACEAKASEKKLAGAAKNSFMKKCEAEGQAAK